MREDDHKKACVVPLGAGSGWWNRLLSGWKNESGQAIVFGALGFCTVLACTAFAVDMGLIFQVKRKVQIAADAAAMAAAQDYLYNQSQSSAITAGKTASSNNGYTDGGNATVTINEPPVDGYNIGNTGMVEATVSTSMSTIFAKLVGYKSMTVEGRAVAGMPTAGDACIWLMNPNAADLQVQGDYNVVATNCGIYDNSSASDSVSVTGNGGTVNAAFLDTVGTAVGQQTQPTPVTTGTSPRSNPWGNISGPTPSTGAGCTYVDQTDTFISGNFTTAGYSGCSSSSGACMPGAGQTLCFTQAVTLSNATFGACNDDCTIPGGESITTSAGTLVFGNGVTIAGNVAVYGGAIDIQNGTFNQNNANLSIVAATSGTYNGIGLMQPSTNTNLLQVQFGSGNETLDGYIYAPGAEVYLQDNGGGIVIEGLVANSLYDKASSLTVNSYDLLHSGTSLNRVLTMVE